MSQTLSRAAKESYFKGQFEDLDGDLPPPEPGSLAAIHDAFEEKLKSMPLTNQEELDAVLAVQREMRDEIFAFYDRKDEENRKRHEEQLARYAAEAPRWEAEARARRAKERREGLIEWLEIICVVGFIALLCLVFDGSGRGGPSCELDHMGYHCEWPR